MSDPIHSERFGSAPIRAVGFQHDPKATLGGIAAPQPRANDVSELSIPLLSAFNEATRCIQCGFCLPACPTYKVFGEEKHSPRGRIQLVKAWAEGKTEPDTGLLTALDLCLDCRACETACPIDVGYGQVLTGARDELARLAADPKTSRTLERAKDSIFRSALRHIVAQPRKMRFLVRFTHRILHSRPGKWVHNRIARRPDSWLASALMFARALPAPPNQRQPELEPKQPQSDRKQPQAVMSEPSSMSGKLSRGQAELSGAQAPSTSVPHGRPPAALLLGCAQEGMFPDTNSATATLLHESGFDVTIPANQGCCGALHRHHGDKPFARTLALRNLHAFGAFDESRNDLIVMNAGGCMAWIKEATELFEAGSDEYRAAQRMAARTRDISEVLLESSSGDRTAPGAVSPGTTRSVRVVYQPSCHLTNVCGISAEPLELLQRITGGNASLPADGGSCCGSAGIYNALHPEASRAILDPKMEAIMDVDPEVIVTSNPGCHLQMLAGVQACGLEGTVRVMQLADFVAEYGMNTK